MRTLVVFSLVAIFVGGCSCGTDENRQEPSTPTGSIVGTVTDLRNGDALEGVSVSVLVVDDGVASAVIATTDVAGTYALTDLPAGTIYRVSFSLDTYVDRFTYAEIPNEAGEFPQGNGLAVVDMPMAAADASMGGNIYVEGGAPADGAVVSIDLRPSSFDLVLEATADGAGGYQLTGLPAAPGGLEVNVVVAPYDADGDGQADYDAMVDESATYPGTETTLDFDLRSVSADLFLIASDLSDGRHAGADAIVLVFNRPLDADRTTVTLTDNTVTRAIAVTPSVAGATLTVESSDATAWPEAHSLTLAVAARATNGATASPSNTFQVVSGQVGILPAVTGLTVLPDTGTNWNTNGFALAWTAVSGAAGYRVFARDDGPNPSYLLLNTVGSTPAPTSNPTTLPATFDYYTGDPAPITPFLWGTSVDFVVVAVDIYGVGSDPGDATPVTRNDVVDPIISSDNANVPSANNVADAPIVVELVVNYSEYIDPASSVTISFEVGGLSGTHTLDPGLRTGRFAITIPALTDGRGGFTVNGAVDTSGNVMPAYFGILN